MPFHTFMVKIAIQCRCGKSGEATAELVQDNGYGRIAMDTIAARGFSISMNPSRVLCDRCADPE